MKRRIQAIVPLGDPALADPFAAIAAAAEIGARAGMPACATLIGRPEHVGAAAQQAAAEGAAEIHLLGQADLADPPLVEHLAAIAEATLRAETGPVLVVLPAGAIGEELAARLSLRLDAVALGRCASVTLEGGAVVATRAAYGGRAELTLSTEADRCLAALRRPLRTAVVAAAPRVRLADVALRLPADIPQRDVLPAAEDRPRRVDAARLVVSGGRGMGGPEGFAMLRELAALLDAATGASLPAVDAGWASVAQQVGQSGAFVAPDLYLAVAMSGTPQHLAGIATHTRIVAINSDPEADIFRVAELGLVASWQEALPRLIEILRDA